MRLDFFMFADGANAADGQVYIHGGAITKVHPPTYPSPPIMLSAVVRLFVDPGETGTHTVTLEAQRPSEPAWVALIGGDVRVPPASPEERKAEEDRGVLIVANLLIAFVRPGSHQFRVKVDGRELATRRLFVTPLDDPSRSETTPPSRPQSTETPPQPPKDPPDDEQHHDPR
jgi:hypothetical protein